MNPKPNGLEKLTFKDESEMDGQIIGPLYYVTPQGKSPVYTGKFGADWVTLADARRLAKRLKVRLEEV